MGGFATHLLRSHFAQERFCASAGAARLPWGHVARENMRELVAHLPSSHVAWVGGQKMDLGLIPCRGCRQWLVGPVGR